MRRGRGEGDMVGGIKEEIRLVGGRGILVVQRLLESS